MTDGRGSRSQSSEPETDRLVQEFFADLHADDRAPSFERMVRGLPATAVVFVVLYGFLRACAWPFSLRVHQEGLVGRSFWGPLRFVRWQDIVGLRADASSGLTFLIIEAAGGQPSLWTLPDVVDRDEFQRLARGLAPPQSPILLGAG